MNRTRIGLFAILLLAAIPSLRVFALGSSASFNPQSHHTSAVDAKGIRHEGTDYKGNPPWLVDRLSGIAPHYPIEERRQHHQGTAYYRLILDLNSGHVVRVDTIESTGFYALDNSAITAFRTWTWRPRKWREIDIHVGFRIRNSETPLRPGSVRLPPH
jgi:TonB family protein